VSNNIIMVINFFMGQIYKTFIDSNKKKSYIFKNCKLMSRIEELKKQLAAVPDMEGLELASTVSTKEPYFFGDENATYKISALDLGIKRNILRNLAKRDCYVKVFPYNTPFDELKSFNPDGYFLSNGPGDPEPLEQVIGTAQKMIASDKPIFGICLGHQIIGLANGVSSYKMFNGHRGINHPVMNVLTGKGEITSQNHGFAVNRSALENHSDLEITHYHINDNTVAGMRMKSKNCFSVQYHPEASPGPHDSEYLFDDFIANIKKAKNLQLKDWLLLIIYTIELRERLRQET
jgi:carbamoyl-phosphate synthase small subunit